MEFLVPLASAIVGGASAALTGIADDAIRSIYARLKHTLSEQRPDVPVEEVEAAIEAAQPLDEVFSLLGKVELREGEEELTELVTSLCARLEELKATSPAKSKDISLPLPLVLDEKEKITAVLMHPLGPALKPGVFSADRAAKAFSSALTPIRSSAVVSEANALRANADPELPTDSLCLDGLPEPAVVGLYDYWYLTADQAATRGPRMTAALLLMSPLNVWNEFGAEAFHKLPKG